MRLSMILVTVLTILLRFVVRASVDNEYPDNLKEYLDGLNDFAANQTLDENWDGEPDPTVVAESEFRGNISLKKDLELEEVTTHESVLRKSDEDVKKKSPKLDADQCGNPPSINHATILDEKQSRYEVGARVSYVCEYGYIINGAVRSSQCFLSETTQTLYWTDPEMLCTPRSCGDPGFVSHAHRVGSLFTFPNKVSYECNEGYSLRGYGIRYCQTSGTWSGNLPSCEPVFCDPPSHPENGKVYYSSLEFESELRYECDEGFLLRNYQGRICSGNGTWSGDDPICQEAKCDTPMPPEFGSVQVVGGKSSVGSMAIYTCEEDRYLVGSATSKCLDIGEWTFPTPKCLEHCSVPNVPHGEIGKYETHSYYRRKTFKKVQVGSKVKDREELYLKCEDKYEPNGESSIEEKITCSLYEWSVVPRCEPAKCRGHPPVTENARVSRTNTTHGGGVVYLCNRSFKKVQYGSVVCNFGNWKGTTPVCKDTRCFLDKQIFPGIKEEGKRFYSNGQRIIPTCEDGYTLAKENNKLTCSEGIWKGLTPPCIADSCYSKELGKSENLASDIAETVLSGEYLQVKCKEGFKPSGKWASCEAGVWTVNGKLCEEGNCVVHFLNNGRFTRREEKKKWNYAGFYYDRWNEYKKIDLGGEKRPGSSLYVTCDAGYTFQGKGSNDVSVKCTSGKWNPHPVCLITGAPYVERSTSHVRVDPKPAEMGATSSKVLSTTRQPLLLTSETGVLKLHSTIGPSVTPYPSCSCTYRNIDTNLVAYAGTEHLKYGAKVKDNSTVKFHCLPFGYSRLNGPSEIICKECRSWHSSEFPDCVSPSFGDSIIDFLNEDNWKLLPGGQVGITKDGSLHIRCSASSIRAYPEWITPNAPNIETQKLTLEENGHYYYINIMTISNASSKHNGQYQCSLGGKRPISIDIHIIEPRKVSCPKFEDDELIINYDKGLAVNSSAVFSCKINSKKLVGFRVTTCLPNGKWNGDPPQCITVCAELSETEGMSISYSRSFNEGSIAAFHCFAPRLRFGVSHATCKANGEWSDPIPSCSFPSCSLDSFFQVVPENVVPTMENITSDTLPFNFTLRLTCDNNLNLIGSQSARCGKDGLWEVDKVQCVTGCFHPLKTKNSEIIIEPDKSFYRFGEFVTLSCPPGQVLSSDVVRLMCLGTGWSQQDLPSCEIA